jgi:hypothetical protein
MHKAPQNSFSRGDIQMNTCLSNVYLKVSKIDSRYIRLALMLLALAGMGRFVVQGLPISGDVGI